MDRTKHKVFISYHHGNDQGYKKKLLDMNERHQIFLDCSVDTGDIDEDLPDQRIREIIRDDYLRDSKVTLLLVGTETRGRKHIDWEIYSSMFDGQKNKKSGIFVINLPTVDDEHCTTAHEGEKKMVFSDITDWTTVNSRAEYDRRFPDMPARIIDNLLKEKAMISVTSWKRIVKNPDALWYLIDAAFKDREKCEYDLRREMRRRDS